MRRGDAMNFTSLEMSPYRFLVLPGLRTVSCYYVGSFEHGHKAVNGYVMNHGVLMRVIGDDFPRIE